MKFGYFRRNFGQAAAKAEAQRKNLAAMKKSAALAESRKKTLVEGWLSLEEATLAGRGEKKKDMKRKSMWVELTPGLLCLHEKFLGEASSLLPLYGSDIRVAEKLERKPGTSIFGGEKIPVYYLWVDIAEDSISRARGNSKYATICFRFEDDKATFENWDMLLRDQSKEQLAAMEDEMTYTL